MYRKVLCANPVVDFLFITGSRCPSKCKGHKPYLQVNDFMGHIKRAYTFMRLYFYPHTSDLKLANNCLVRRVLRLVCVIITVFA